MSETIDRHMLQGEGKVLLAHEGNVNKAVLLDTLPKLESVLDEVGVDKPRKRKLVNIAIEALQNLQVHAHHSSLPTSGIQPVFTVTKEQDAVHVTIGNLIKNDERKVLEDKLNKINSLNEDEVKFLYGVIMKQTAVKFSSKGGAGLGLIDMKKKSGNPLVFSFQEIDDDISYFSLRVTVPV